MLGISQIWPGMPDYVAISIIILAILGLVIWVIIEILEYGTRRGLKRRTPNLLWQWKLRIDGWLPFHRLVSLERASKLAYRKTHGSLLSKEAERPHSADKNPNPVHYYAGYLVKTKHIPLYGYNCVTSKFERIPSKLMPSCFISEDITKFIQIGKKEALYEGLAVKRKDFNERLTRMRKEWPAENT